MGGWHGLGQAGQGRPAHSAGPAVIDLSAIPRGAAKHESTFTRPVLTAEERSSHGPSCKPMPQQLCFSNTSWSRTILSSRSGQGPTHPHAKSS